jgi:hypothetical protein
MLVPILRLGPAHALVPLRTGRHLRLPIEGKVADRIAAVLALLPTRLLAHRSDDLRAQFGLAHQLGTAGIALVHIVLGRSQVVGAQVLVDGSQHLRILQGRHRRFHLRDQMRAAGVLITGLGQMHFC